MSRLSCSQVEPDQFLNSFATFMNLVSSGAADGGGNGLGAN
jgi:hypothetical protein